MNPGKIEAHINVITDISFALNLGLTSHDSEMYIMRGTQVSHSGHCAAGVSMHIMHHILLPSILLRMQSFQQ